MEYGTIIFQQGQSSVVATGLGGQCLVKIYIYDMTQNRPVKIVILQDITFQIIPNIA